MKFKEISVNGTAYGGVHDMKPEDVKKLPEVTNVDFED